MNGKDNKSTAGFPQVVLTHFNKCANLFSPTNIGYEIYAWKAKKNVPFHPFILKSIFIWCYSSCFIYSLGCHLTCRRYIFLLFYFLCLSQSFFHWINLFAAFPQLSTYAATNLNIQTHSFPITQLWNAWADHNS